MLDTLCVNVGLTLVDLRKQHDARKLGPRIPWHNRMCNKDSCTTREEKVSVSCLSLHIGSGIQCDNSNASMVRATARLSWCCRWLNWVSGRRTHIALSICLCRDVFVKFFDKHGWLILGRLSVVVEILVLDAIQVRGDQLGCMFFDGATTAV